MTWTVGDLAKAGSLLHVPQIGANFDDEQEMRRVYTLIYDVFRYKSILMQALNDINFFQIYEKLEKSAPIVWLLFYDLQHRAFKKREAIEQRLASKLFQYAKMTFAENALWCQRIKLAAAVSRIRIKHNALALSELLPAHLRNDRIARAAARSDGPLTVWVNNKKFKNNNDIIRQIEHTLKLKYVEDAKDLGPENFKWDRHCPLTIAFHCSMRQEVAQSSLVKTHKLIVQDRSFCLGPATFWKVVEDLQLCGNVVQTHVNSPRATAYLAILLSQNEKISKLMAFSAGKRKNEYESYLNKLGMTNVEVYSDKLVDLGQESAILEEVVAVYATPPNSYSAVNDPVDLVCSRGGDLSMLEILTESEDSIEGRNRVTKILEEQRKTLKFAMSRPQIQVVLYETHSELDIENTEMVNKSINDINKIAKLHHASLQGLITDLINDSKEIVDQGDGKEINNNDENNGKGDSINSNDERSINVNLNQFNQQDLQKVKVPDTDLFDSPELPSLCPNTNECLNTGGCYLALLQRKQVIRLDNKYMIQMAEQRGLFGTTSNNSLKSKLAKQQRKKYQQPKIEVKPKRSRKKFKEIEVDRIAAPTHAFLQHMDITCHECKRCKLLREQQAEDEAKSNRPYKKWWCETTRYISDLKESLVKQKIIPSVDKKSRDHKAAAVRKITRSNFQIDELAAKHNKNRQVPVHPKLKLPRERVLDKVAMSLPVTLLTLSVEEFCVDHRDFNFFKT